MRKTFLSENKRKIIKFKTFIAPWVLPNEEIPAHLIWNNDFKFDYLNIILPDNIILKDILNVKNWEINKNIINFSKENIQKTNFPKYFGFVVVYNLKPAKKLKIFKDIKIQFYRGDIQIYEKILTAKIFRPKLIDTSQINPLVLKDEELDINIPLTLECIGFGFIDLKLRAEINKICISVEKNLIEKVQDNLEKKYTFILDEKEKNGKKKIFINKKSIDNFFKVVENYQKLLKKNKESSEKKKIEKKITEFLEENNIERQYIIDLFLELLNQIKIRNKFENVLMRDSHLEIPRDNFNEFIKKIVIFVSYKDLIGNKYEDLEIPLTVKDLRKQPQKTKINFKVNIENITNETFIDIEKTRRD